jgi:hypothetical protein
MAAPNGGRDSVGIVVAGLQCLVYLIGQRLRSELIKVAAGGSGEEF